MPTPFRTPGQRVRRREIANASAGHGPDWHGPDPITAPPPLSDDPPTLIDGRTCPPVVPSEQCPRCDDRVESFALHSCPGGTR
ncbi:hypothetical protein [Streptomyces sp. SBT349]|uniref:hypothetical protein n=1 Tax=Streptomyces sp. SBT349 TaxID=1580539 RepID=UPI00066BCB28|nr:hypothetical protein [Streptomyces sp. SBT349]